MIVVFILISPGLLQGCDSFSASDPEEPSYQAQAPTSKLRHAGLLDIARVTHTAGKTESSSTQLVLGLNIYEADGVTPRLLDKYDVTRRLLDKYGITKRLLDKYGDDIRFKVTYDQAINAITVKVNDERLEEFLQDIEADADFSWVEPDIEVTLPVLARVNGGKQKKQLIPWSIDRIGAYADQYLEFNEVDVYVFDSGVYQHNDLVLKEYKDFTMLFENRAEAYWDEDLMQELPVYDPGERGDPNDYSGHGTHIAGIIGANDNAKGIVGGAPMIGVNSLKVLTEDGQTDITTLLAAVDYVTQVKLANPQKAIIVNMSLGADIGTTTYNVLDHAIVNSIEAGVVYVISAGNDGRDASTYSPAHVKEAITVGSYDFNDTFSSFSNYGSVVDILAPGEQIVSLSNIREEVLNNDAILATGTSFAAPHVTAAAAHYMRTNPGASPAMVREALVNAGIDRIANAPAHTTAKTVYAASFYGGEVEASVDVVADSDAEVAPDGDQITTPGNGKGKGKN